MRIVGAVLLTIAIAIPAATWRVDGAAQTAAVAGSEDSSHIKAVAEKYRKASLAGDTKTIMALYADNAIEMPPNSPARKGKAEIEAFYKEQMKAAKLTALNFTHIDSRASGDIGYDVGSYTQTLKPTSGEEVKDSGHYTVILRKIGGEWKVASAIYNSDRPAEHTMKKKTVQTTGTEPKP